MYTRTCIVYAMLGVCMHTTYYTKRWPKIIKDAIQSIDSSEIKTKKKITRNYLGYTI